MKNVDREVQDAGDGCYFVFFCGVFLFFILLTFGC